MKTLKERWIAISRYKTVYKRVLSCSFKKWIYNIGVAKKKTQELLCSSVWGDFQMGRNSLTSIIQGHWPDLTEKVWCRALWEVMGVALFIFQDGKQCLPCSKGQICSSDSVRTKWEQQANVNTASSSEELLENTESKCHQDHPQRPAMQPIMKLTTKH